MWQGNIKYIKDFVIYKKYWKEDINQTSLKCKGYFWCNFRGDFLKIIRNILSGTVSSQIKNLWFVGKLKI